MQKVTTFAVSFNNSTKEGRIKLVFDNGENTILKFQSTDLASFTAIASILTPISVGKSIYWDGVNVIVAPQALAPIA